MYASTFRQGLQVIDIGQAITEYQQQYAANPTHVGQALTTDGAGHLGVRSVSIVYSPDVRRFLGLQPPSQETTPVASFDTNGFGLYDMAGNALEWTADRASPYASGAVTDPIGAAAGDHHVLRGGSWAVTGKGARVSSRYATAHDFAANTIGFRCARDAGAE